MSYPTYEITTINEAIHSPKGDKAGAVGFHGLGIDPLLNYCKNNLPQDDLSKAEDIIEKLREYVKRNCGKKFKTKRYAEELVSNLESILRDHCDEYPLRTQHPL